MRSTLDNASKFLRLLFKRRSAYPREIQIEVTNACNLQCAMCPHTHGNIPQDHFPWDRFESLVKNNPPPKRLVLTGWGEPLLHEDFFRMIELTNQQWPRCRVRFTTNGILLEDNFRQKMLSHHVSGITVSVDLWQDRKDIPKTWRDILHPPSPKTFRNLKEYCSHQDVCLKTPITLQSLLVNENVDDLKQIIQFASEHQIRSMNLVRMQSYPDYPVERPSWEQEQQMITELKRWGSQKGVSVRSVNQQHVALRLATHSDRVCMRTDDSLYITIHGVITPCCNLRDYSIGRLSPEASIADAWHSSEEVHFFSHQPPVCRSCDALFHNYHKDPTNP